MFKSKWVAKFYWGTLLLSLSQSVWASHGAGNGGGAWVCRETDGSIRWSKLVDFFEADADYGLTLTQYPGGVHDVVDEVQLRIFRADRDLYEALAPYIEKVAYLEPNPPQIKYTQDVLEKIDDALYDQEPSPKKCVGGKIHYEQVVNYKDDGRILVQSEILNSLSDNMKAGLVLHEAIYAYRRDRAGDKDSILSRRMVGLIFSTLSTEDLKKTLSDLGESEIGAIGMKFVSVKPGSFMMGSPSSEAGRVDDEKQHLVTLTHSFEMQATDVTQAQYAQVMGKNPSVFQMPENCPKTFKVVQNITMCPNNPVENVSWIDAQIFISKLNSTRKDGHFYRLPTEAEWEYAARAGTQTAYSFGNDPSQLFQYSWFSGNSGNQTHEVAQLKANPLGLYDMQGNVWQWVQDFYGDYGNSQTIDPPGPSSGSGRVIRGGGWGGGALGLRSAIRGGDFPYSHYSVVGFRLVRTQ